VVISTGADAVLGTPGGIDDHMIAGGILAAIGIKKVYFLAGAELDVYHFHGFDRQSLVFFH